MHATRCKRYGAVNVFRGLAIAAAVAQNAAIGDLRMSGPIPEKRSSSLSATLKRAKILSERDGLGRWSLSRMPSTLNGANRWQALA